MDPQTLLRLLESRFSGQRFISFQTVHTLPHIVGSRLRVELCVRACVHAHKLIRPPSGAELGHVSAMEAWPDGTRSRYVMNLFVALSVGEGPSESSLEDESAVFVEDSHAMRLQVHASGREKKLSTRKPRSR